MLIEFIDIQLKNQCEIEKLSRKAWGAPAAKQLAKRLMQIQAAENLHIFRSIAPNTKPHPLERSRKGQWSVTVHKGLRLIFRPLNPLEEYTLEDGGVDWRSITEIILLEVKDYHDKKR